MAPRNSDDDVPPFHLTTPPGFQANHIPKGTLLLYCVFVFTLNRLFYPASSVHPVSVLIPYPRNTDSVVTDWEIEDDQKPKKYAKFKCQASEMPACRVRQHNNTSKTRK